MKPHLLVVGASRGLGSVVAKISTGEGYQVSTIARTSTSGQGRYACDICDPKATKETLKKIAHERGSFNGAAFFQRFRSTGDDWQGELNTTLTATRGMIEDLAPLFATAGERSIVLVSSVNAIYINLKLPASYHVAKAGLCQLAKYYACQLGEKGIRVNAVCPSTFIKPENESRYSAGSETLARLCRASPLNRAGTAADVANAVMFLLGNKSSFITGQSLLVDGGTSLRWQEELIT